MSARTASVALALAFAACAPAPLPAPVAPPRARPRASAPPPPPLASSKPKPAQAPPAPTAKGPIGGATPLVFEAAGRDASWVATCVAGADTDGNGKLEVSIGPSGELGGDALASMLVIGDAAPTAIDELAAFDDTGRWLVVKRAGKLVLIDAHAGTETTLEGADARDDGTPYAAHRAVSFDAQGSRLMFVRRRAPRSDVVVRDLATGKEAHVDPGPGKLWRAELSPDGQLVVLHMIVNDTNKNGRLGWPVPERKKNDWRCHAPVAGYNAWLDRGDTPVVAVAPSSGGTARAVPGFVAPFGTAVLVRDENDRLLLDRGSGARVELADAKCFARVLHADPSRGLVVAACSGAKLRPPVELLGVGLRQSTGFDLGAADADSWPDAAPERLFAFHPGTDTALIDLDRKRVEVLNKDDRVAATWGARALLIRARSLVVFDADSAHDSRAAGRLHPRLRRRPGVPGRADRGGRDVGGGRAGSDGRRSVRGARARQRRQAAAGRRPRRSRAGDRGRRTGRDAPGRGAAALGRAHAAARDRL